MGNKIHGKNGKGENGDREDVENTGEDWLAQWYS